MQLLRSAAIAALLTASGASRAPAQIDYRNLDDERPVRTEDAYPVDRYALEILTPLTFESAADAQTWLFAPEAEYGVLRNTQVGVKLPLAITEAAGTKRSGLGGLFLYALYNFNTESRTLPAIGLRADVGLPPGSLGGDGVRVTLKGLATRSWGRWRAHVNFAGTLGPEGDLGVEALPRWMASLAMDRTLFRQSLLLIGDVAVLQSAQETPTQVEAALGLRWQWRPATVLDAGIRRRLTAAGPDIQLTIGLTSALGIRALMPARPAAELPHGNH